MSSMTSWKRRWCSPPLLQLWKPGSERMARGWTAILWKRERDSGPWKRPAQSWKRHPPAKVLEKAMASLGKGHLKPSIGAQPWCKHKLHIHSNYWTHQLLLDSK
jgi:hypothetical protein